MRISDWSSDVCSSDLYDIVQQQQGLGILHGHDDERLVIIVDAHFKYRGNFIGNFAGYGPEGGGASSGIDDADAAADLSAQIFGKANADRSEEHTSELQSLMRISYAVFCLKKKKQL